MQPTAAGITELDVDPFSDESIDDREALDTLVREAAPAVRLSRYGVWATGRHEHADRVMRSWEEFTSTAGTGLHHNGRDLPWREPSPILEADPPEHKRFRAVMTSGLSARALKRFDELLEQRATALVDQVLDEREFDAATALAAALPFSVVPDLVGMPTDRREMLMPYAQLNFESMGPRNDRYAAAVREAEGASEYSDYATARANLTPDGVGAQLYAAADAAGMPERTAQLLVRTFVGAGIDTTMYSLGSTLHALIADPDQWKLLRQEPGLAKNAFEEGLRHETPGPLLGRTTTRALDIGGVPIPADERVLVFVHAGNRDPRRWEAPGKFDLTRRAAGHLTFGRGVHTCVGAHLARLEAQALLSKLAERVVSWEFVAPPTRIRSNWLQGWKSLPVRITPA